MTFRTVRWMTTLALAFTMLAPESYAQRGGGGNRGGGGDRGGGFRGGGPSIGGGIRGNSGGGNVFRGGGTPRGNLGSVPSFSRPSAPNLSRSVPNLQRSVPNLQRSIPQMQTPRQTFGQSPNARPNLPQNVRPNLPNLPDRNPLTNRPNLGNIQTPTNPRSTPIVPRNLPNQIGGTQGPSRDAINRSNEARRNLDGNRPTRESVSRPDASGNRLFDNNRFDRDQRDGDRFDGRFDRDRFDGDRFDRDRERDYRHWHHAHWNPYRYNGWNRGNWAIWGPNFGFSRYGYGFGPNYGYGYGPWGRYGWYNRPWGRWAALGLTSWALGGAYYNTGYGVYTNPYYVSGVDYGYNYGQPIAYVATSEPQAPADDVALRFQAARDAFRNGDYQAALQEVDQALAKNPNDPALHEFRSLTFFALQRYTEAAGAIYAVLSVGPGMNWSSMMSLYPSVEVYTPQLRALEAFARQNPQEATGRFILAYHYMVAGHTNEARAQFQKASSLAPNDSVSRQMVRLLTPPEPSEATTENTLPPASPPANLPPALSQPVGSFQATTPRNGTINLTLRDDGTFQWNLNEGDSPREFTGKYTLEGETLALEFQDGGGMVGRVQQKGTGFHFAIIDGPQNDPGLDFSRRNQ